MAAAAQSVAGLPSFDVASLKPNTEVGSTIQVNLGTARHGEVKLNNTNLNDCLRFAYDLASNDQIDGPDWMGSYKIRFDIDAKAQPDTPRDKLLLMLQRLLTERFHLQMHRAPKSIAHFDIEVAKDGLKLQPATEDPADRMISYGRGLLHYKHIPMSVFAVLLSRQLKQPVFDRTGLEGFFDVKLEWRPDDTEPVSRGPDAANLPAVDNIESRPDLFHAMQAQLGLRLTASKAPIEVLVIDHADQTPVGN